MSKIMITGATGKIGRRAVDILAGTNKQVVAVTRQPNTKFPEGVSVLQADISHPETLKDVLSDVSVLLLIPSAVERGAKELVSLAIDQGVERLVLISAVTVTYGGGYKQFSERFKRLEDIVRGSGLPWTILRSADFDANALAWANQIAATGEVKGAYGNAKAAPIHEADLAAVAAKVLIDTGHDYKSYDLTGPKLLSQIDKVEAIGNAIHRQLVFTEVDPAIVKTAMLAQGLPEDIPDRMLGYLKSCIDAPGPVTKTVAELLGRPAASFEDWARENAEAFQTS